MSGIAWTLALRWPVNVCHYCGIVSADVDGDRVRWVNQLRNVCSRGGCPARFAAEVRRASQRPKSRRMTPGQVAELIRRRGRRKRRAA